MTAQPGYRNIDFAAPDGLELLVFGPRYETDGEVLRDKFWPEEADK